ncbi:MAG: hypothetical protein ABSB42_04920 [Tepidisphaeraceae bacterium]|jgi:hypothetical protein
MSEIKWIANKLLHQNLLLVPCNTQGRRYPFTSILASYTAIQQALRKGFDPRPPNSGAD